MSSDLIIRPSVINGLIKVPGSKSHTIRALVIAGLAEGESIVRNPLISYDTLSCIKALEKIGVLIKVEQEKQSIIKVKGIGGELIIRDPFINVGNSGTTLRIITAVAALSGEKINLDGDESIRKRPMQPLLSALYDIGAIVDSDNGHAPLSIYGPVRGGETMTDGISSQFLTAMLLACPLAEGDTKINVIDLHEKPYIEMTLRWLDSQNIEYSHEDYKNFYIKGNQSYSPFTFDIPGDFSTATFPLAASAVTGGNIRIKGLNMNDSQGDKRVFNILEKMGAAINHESEGIVVRGGQLKGIALDLNDIPDALPALAVTGCAAEGETRLLNVEQARFKESDRIHAICMELKKMGAEIREMDDGLIIRKSQLKGTEVNGYNDHRIVMALSIAGMIASGETVIKEGSEAVNITYPSFINDFKNLGVNIRSGR